MTLSSKWRDYTEVISELREVTRKRNIFPSRQSLADEEKTLREKLFNYYTGFYNVNNTISVQVVLETVKKWIEKNTEFLQDFEFDIEREKVLAKHSTNTTVRNAVDDIAPQLIEIFCFSTQYSSRLVKDKGFDESLSEVAKEIVSFSENYTEFPNTKENLDIFLNQSTKYLKKNTFAQEQGMTDSPIETIMFEELKGVARKRGLRVQREYPVYDEGRLEIRYSLDIVFIDSNGDVVLDIETDGLSYHKGYQNMTNDRRRDRWLLIRGIPTMRFTSKEVFNNLKNCVIEIEAALDGLTKRRKSKR